MARGFDNPNTQGPFGNTLLHSAVLSGDIREVQKHEAIYDLRSRSEDHLERLLDQALEDTFPASDPIAVSPIPA